MDDNAKNASSYQHDQEILDARGINMTVEDVAGLPTCKYSERVQSLNLNEDDLIFLKGLRRRIRNRLASQNSRRRSVENLRRLTRELRAVRACRRDALAERRGLLARRAALRARCVGLRTHIVGILDNRSDKTEVPELEPERMIESPQPEMYLKSQVFECRIDKLVQQSVNHIYKEKDKLERDKCKMTEQVKDAHKINQNNKYGFDEQYREVYRLDQEYKDVSKLDPKDLYKLDRFEDAYKADSKDVYRLNRQFEDAYKADSKDVYRLDPKDVYRLDPERDGFKMEQCDMYKLKRQDRVCAKTVFIGTGEEVLNLSKKKSHGRKQSAPRRITYVFTEPDEDGVLDLKIKKEPE